MLASCDGGEQDRENKVRPRHKVHCDAKKENDDIPVSPLDKNIENYLMFFDDGTVKGKGDIGKKLVKILGLDTDFLTIQRRNAIANYKVLPILDWHAEIERLKIKGFDGKYEEFCFVLQNYAELCYELESQTSLVV